MGICQIPKLIIGSKNTEKGYIQIYQKNADALILGDATHEGGDVKIYRDTSGNLQVSIDADAASSAIGMSIYAGAVFQNKVAIGQATLGAYTLQVAGSAAISTEFSSTRGIVNIANGYGIQSTSNATNLFANIPVTSGTANHALKLQIDSNDIIVVQATGNDDGTVINLAVGFFGVTPQVQQAHIVDAANAAGDPPTQAEYNAFVAKFNTLLADLEGYGLLLTS